MVIFNTASSLKLQWSSEAISAFIAAREALAISTLLTYLKANTQTSLIIDASDTTVGAAIHWRSVALNRLLL